MRSSTPLEQRLDERARRFLASAPASRIRPRLTEFLVFGLKQGWAFAWRSLLAGELLVAIANRPSLGQFLYQSREFGEPTYMISLMIAILVIGIVVDAVFATFDNSIRRNRGVNGNR